jgi:hypothetical protein
LLVVDHNRLRIISFLLARQEPADNYQADRDHTNDPKRRGMFGHQRGITRPGESNIHKQDREADADQDLFGARPTHGWDTAEASIQARPFTVGGVNSTSSHLPVSQVKAVDLVGVADAVCLELSGVDLVAQGVAVDVDELGCFNHAEVSRTGA